MSCQELSDFHITNNSQYRHSTYTNNNKTTTTITTTTHAYHTQPPNHHTSNNNVLNKLPNPRLRRPCPSRRPLLSTIRHVQPRTRPHILSKVSRALPYHFNPHSRLFLTNRLSSSRLMHQHTKMQFETATASSRRRSPNPSNGSNDMASLSTESSRGSVGSMG